MSEEKSLREIILELASKPIVDKKGKVFYITHNGICNLEEWSRDKIVDVNIEKLTLLATLIPLIFINKQRTLTYSYGGKHVVEAVIGNYISNGEFILVMLALGYNYKYIEGHNISFHGIFIDNIFEKCSVKQFKYKFYPSLLKK